MKSSGAVQKIESCPGNRDKIASMRIALGSSWACLYFETETSIIAM